MSYKPPLNYMMLHEDTLADEFDAILGLRTSHAGVVLPGTSTLFSPFLAYGSTDASVVFRHTLKSVIPAGAISGFSSLTNAVVGNAAGPEHDSTKGMRGAITGLSTASAYYITGWPAGLDTAGQMTFEISRKYLVQDSGQYPGSDGDTFTPARSALSWQNHANSNNGAIAICYRAANSGGQVGFRRLFTTVDITHWFLGWAARTANAGRFHSYGKTGSEFVTVCIGWATIGGTRRVIMSVDGVVLQTMTRDDTANPFTSLCLGGSASTFGGFASFTDNFPGIDHWIRNIQVSTTAPVQPTATTGVFQSIAIMSDSIINASTPENTNFGDLNYDVRIIKALEQAGVTPTTLYRMSAGGHLMTELADGATTYSFQAGNTATQTATDGVTAADVRGRVSGRNCKTLVINGGSNDVAIAAVTPTVFRNAVRDHICYFLGLNGTSWGGTDYSGSPPASPPTRIYLTNIADRGYSWHDTEACTYSSGATTLTVVSGLGYFRNGDEIGGTHIQAGTTIVSGGGTGTVTISLPTTNSGTNQDVYNVTTAATSVRRAKAALFRTELAAIPGWFADTYPALWTITIEVIDIFTAMGGLDSYTGKIQSDGVHPDYAAVMKIGDAIGAAFAGDL